MSWGCNPQLGPGYARRGNEPNTEPRLAVGGQWGRSPHKHQNPSRAGRGRGGPPPACIEGTCPQRLTHTALGGLPPVSCVTNVRGQYTPSADASRAGGGG